MIWRYVAKHNKVLVWNNNINFWQQLLLIKTMSENNIAFIYLIVANN